MRGLKKIDKTLEDMVAEESLKVRAIVNDKAISDKDADSMIVDINRILLSKGVPEGQFFLTRSQQWV